MSDREVELLPAMPKLRTLFAKALLPSFATGPARIPDHTAVVTGLRPDPARLADYDRVCGFTLRDQVPPTWLHVLTFPLHIHLLSSPASTVRLAGLVHVSNRMRLHRRVRGTEGVDVAVRVENLRPHRRGALLDIVGEVRVGEELVWDGISTYLAPGAVTPGTPEAAPRPAFAPERPTATWRLPAGLGVEYRRVSGDPNPIHTSHLAAKAFGFSRPIIQGMWTHARLLAAIEQRLPETYSIEVGFTKPILLPSRVGAWWKPVSDGWTGAVTTRDGVKPHLLAQIHV